MAKTPDIAQALLQTLISPNEADANMEAANVVDGLFSIARAIHHLAKAVERVDRTINRVPSDWGIDPGEGK